MPFGSQFSPRTIPAVQSGALRRRLTIQYVSDNTPDGAGGYTPVWATLCMLWGSLAPWKPYQLIVGQQVQEAVYVRYLTRYPPSTQIKAGMRLVDEASSGSGGTTYTIISAMDPDGSKRQLQISCEQVAPGT